MLSRLAARRQLPPGTPPWKEQALSTMGAEGMSSPQAGCRSRCVLQLAFVGEAVSLNFPQSELGSPKETECGELGCGRRPS